MATGLQVNNNDECIKINIDSVSDVKIKDNTVTIRVNSMRASFELTYKNKEQAEEVYNIIERERRID